MKKLSLPFGLVLTFDHRPVVRKAKIVIPGGLLLGAWLYIFELLPDIREFGIVFCLLMGLVLLAAIDGPWGWISFFAGVIFESKSKRILRTTLVLVTGLFCVASLMALATQRSAFGGFSFGLLASSILLAIDIAEEKADRHLKKYPTTTK